MPFDREKFYLTTPIYYANARPHLGTLYTTVLADTITRINKIAGCKTFFLTGTDEHGQKIAQAAEAAGQEPQVFVDAVAQAFKDVWRLYDIQYDTFIRTTDEYHIKGVQAWIEKLYAQGDIYKGTYTGWYCVPDETFVGVKEPGQDKPLECPACGRQTVEISEECYFFRLSRYQEQLLDFYRKHPHFITPPERLNEVIAFVEAGLRDLSISRTGVAWGIPFPGDEKHTVYVWADALNNYITAIGYGDPQRVREFNFWWPADLQIMAKEIVRFHAVYWPAFLIAAGLELPRQLLVHGWIKMGEHKMSKSLGNIIDPVSLAEKYGADSIRHYLVRHMAVTQDSPFTVKDLEARLNADLAHDLGNLLNRMTALAVKNGLTTVPAPAQLGSAELGLRDKLWSMLGDFSIEMEEYYVHRAYAAVWKFVGYANAYFHAQEPWVVAKTDPERFSQIISAACHSLYALAVMLWPVMPKKTEEIFHALGVSFELGPNHIERLSVDPWMKTFVLKPVPPLFNYYESEEAQAGGKKEDAARSQASGQTPDKSGNFIDIDDLKKVELRVGTIESCEPVEKSDKLYVLRINFGPLGVKQILSGVRQSFGPEELIGKQGVCVLNLKPRMMMGIESQGMMLFVEQEDKKLSLVTVDRPVPDGNPLR